jgi:hypothetical protein
MDWVTNKLKGGAFPAIRFPVRLEALDLDGVPLEARRWDKANVQIRDYLCHHNHYFARGVLFCGTHFLSSLSKLHSTEPAIQR